MASSRARCDPLRPSMAAILSVPEAVVGSAIVGMTIPPRRVLSRHLYREDRGRARRFQFCAAGGRDGANAACDRCAFASLSRAAIEAARATRQPLEDQVLCRLDRC